MASDADFLTASGDGVNFSQSGHVFTDLSDSESDINISGLIEHSDQNLSPIHTPLQSGVTETSQGQASQALGSNRDLTDQNHINAQNLAQLRALGARLDSMENSMKKSVKKTNDSSKIKKSKIKSRNGIAKTEVREVGTAIPSVQMAHIPPPSWLREEARIQEEVQSRLRHLADNVKPGMGKIKSQKDGAVDVFVNHKVRWPHEFVLSGQNKNRVTYNQLSPVQWMAGFCRTIREESDMAIHEHMLDYVIDLLGVATDFSWASAKASHAVLLCRMEHGDIKSWSETQKIDSVPHAHAQRHSTSQYSSQRGQDKQVSGKVTTCVYYNKGVCSQKQTHETKGVLYKHVCASCWAKDGKSYPHPQMECRKNTKN